ncbi:hypothetical protein [Paenibacillus sp. SI8]|uniref:hypothetical protein n=1 Tax=unclassified Paenibacillus TaxID=185978 RepID=UPI003465CD4B
MLEKGERGLPDGIYRAKDIVRELDTLLAAISVQLGEAADSAALLDNPQANLAIVGRESVLPLGSLALGDPARTEIAAQAQNIGEALTNWAREFDSQEWALKLYGEAALGNLTLRSRCDQHLWTHEVADLLIGPATNCGERTLRKNKVSIA